MTDPLLIQASITIARGKESKFRCHPSPLCHFVSEKTSIYMIAATRKRTSQRRRTAPIGVKLALYADKPQVGVKVRYWSAYTAVLKRVFKLSFFWTSLKATQTRKSFCSCT